MSTWPHFISVILLRNVRYMLSHLHIINSFNSYYLFIFIMNIIDFFLSVQEFCMYVQIYGISLGILTFLFRWWWFKTMLILGDLRPC